MKAKKSFGQNWLKDDFTLDTIVDSADISKNDTVLEVGPGLGTLTEKLLQTGARVVAVEADKELIPHLQKKFSSENKFELIQADILKYDLRSLPHNYKVVANIPYYLTSNLLRTFLEATNPPSTMVLLIQKEVAERILAKPGQMSLLAFSVLYYARPEFIIGVKKELFDPIPKVDSAVVRITRHAQPLFEADQKQLFRIVKAGFSERRKKLRNSLSGGLRLDPKVAEEILRNSNIAPNVRAQELSMPEWESLYRSLIRANLL